MWIQTIDNKLHTKNYYYIEYFYTGDKKDRYRIWKSNPSKVKVSLWNKSQDLKDIKDIFGEEKVVGTY